MSSKKDKYPKIGTMTEKRDRATDEPILDDNGNRTYYIKIDKNVELRINGKKVDSGYLNVARPRDKFDRMLKNGHIDKKEHEEKVALYENGGEYDCFKFEISATLED